MLKRLMIALLGFILSCEGIEQLSLDVISYEDFVAANPEALGVLEQALYHKGIAGIRGIPGYKEKVDRFIQAAKEFTALPEAVKEGYAPDRSLGETFLGYEKGKEKFQQQDGKWVIDDLKVSYYAWVPENQDNKRWPHEVDLKTPFQEMGALMAQVSGDVMQKIGLVGSKTGITLEGAGRLGRLLYYCKSGNTYKDNPYWCVDHFDHSMFTTLLPSFYFVDGKLVAEPDDAGLFVQVDGVFKKVASDPDVLMFQVGEFGQLATHDAIRATKHRVQKPQEGTFERYTMALFCNAPMDAVIYSQSELTKDPRYGAKPGEACSYRHWNDATFQQNLVKEGQ